ncbi:MAG TPA: hypothetical protein VIG06_23470 [Kofleriaceae bacterium]|jgi:hypothetical protein
MLLRATVPFLAVALSLTMAACNKRSETDRTGPDPAPTTKRGPAEQKPPTGESSAPPPATGACETLDRAECLRARHCTLHFVKSMEYECRPSGGPCETDLLQGDKAGCEARAGCTWDPGSCYCPFPGYGKTQVADKDSNQGGACACGGGPPPMCKAAAQVDER